MITDLHELYTIKEVAAAKKVSVDYIRKLVRERKVTPFRTSDSKAAPMRFGAQHLEQIDAAMTPTPSPEATTPRRRRRRRT